MNKRRILSAFLSAAMMFGIVGCGETAAPPTEETTPAETEETSEVLTGRAAVSDDLPEKDFKGEAFTVLDRTKYSYEFEAAEENGDLRNDAVYKRNRLVSDRFNVKLQYHTLDCNWGDQATAFNNTLRSSILAGDGAYDLVAGYAATIPGLIAEDLFYNWENLDYVDFTKPWWSETVAKELTINGKSFMVTGDLSISLWEGMTCFFFNKKLAESYHLGNLYEIVSNGEWSLTKLAELTKNVYADVDGDGEHSNGDRYGVLCGRNTGLDNFMVGFEVKVTKRNDQGFPEICFVNEHTIDVITKLNAYFHESGDVLLPTITGEEGRLLLVNAFEEDRGIFFTSTIGVSESFRAMDSDFGILPYPKFDEKQKEYHNSSLDEFSLFVIPKDAKDLEKTAIITEALCAESYKNVVPVIYEKALKTKNARDDDSAAMIDVIRDSLTFEWGYLHSNALNMLGHLFTNMVRANNNDVASSYASGEASYKANLEKVLSIYQ